MRVGLFLVSEESVWNEFLKEDEVGEDYYYHQTEREEQ